MIRNENKNTEDNLDYRSKKEKRIMMASADDGPGISARKIAELPGKTLSEKVEKATGVTPSPYLTLQEAMDLLKKSGAVD